MKKHKITKPDKLKVIIFWIITFLAFDAYLFGLYFVSVILTVMSAAIALSELGIGIFILTIDWVLD